MENSGVIYFVPTPIGNLEDITLRAIRVLKECDQILAEDTRTSSKLLKHFEIETPMRSYHMHNEHKITEQIVEEASAGKTFCLITDAGTPGISDPGFLLAKACIENEVAFEVLPGAVAFIPALIKSGLPNHSFVFEGFLPPKKGRQTKLKSLASEARTMVFYESPYKIEKTLEDMLAHFGNRKASISRELTKLFETTLNSSLEELLLHFKEHKPKGEFVLVVNGAG
ncbi:MAG: 16S rRNA (cytidine(1402)-2'-O)-methyltransferase [Bacteroidetes bacterium]|nr:16S rRNA (cytidine(1402)-2'-O)-methyltransferase [Bacteroidota bacterium]